MVLPAAFALGLAASPAIPRGDDPPLDPLAQFDLEFRQFYATGRAATLKGFGPIIRVERDSLILLHDGERREMAAIPPLYHAFKAVSHMPLALFARLDNTPDGPLDAATLADLDLMRTGIAAVVPRLESYGFSPEQLERQRSIILDELAILDDLRSTKRLDRQALIAFTRQQAPRVLANAADAVAAQFQGYDACLKTWEPLLAAEEWARLRIVISDHQMPRQRNAAAQYFAHKLGVPGEGRRLVYAEAIDDETKALNLLATHQLDSDVGVAFFNDPERMERDLLGDAASVYLDTHATGPLDAGAPR